MSCFQKMMRISSSGFGPDVAPHVTMRPFFAAAVSECRHVAAADRVHDDVHAALSRQLADRLADVRRLVVDRLVRPELPRALELLLRGRRDEDAGRSAQLRDLHGQRRDAAADAVHEHRLSRPERGARHEHAPRREPHERKRRGLLGRKSARRRVDVRPRHGDLFGERAGEVLAEDPEGHAEAALAGEAELARSAREAGLQDDARPGRGALHARPERLDDSRPVGARHVRKGDGHAGDAVPDEDVEPVERGRLDLHENLAGARRGVGPFAEGEDVVAAVRGQEDCFHRCLRSAEISRWPRRS